MRKFCFSMLFLVSTALAQAQSCTTTISTFPYSEGFETSAGNWTAGGTNSSWAWGTPLKPTIYNAATGAKAWATGLTGTYNASEDSYVKSPCFNFTSVNSPVIEMKVWWEAEWSWDGAVLQSSIDGGTTWQNVGAFGDPNNWYTDNSLNGSPGGQAPASAEGWTGNGTLTNRGSGGWVAARHYLSGLGNQPSVMLRIAFASDAMTEFDGFAFDDVTIYEGPAKDAGITSIVTPASGCSLTSQETVTITIKNYGSTPISNFPVSYKINTALPVIETFADTIRPNSIVDFTFATKANLSAYNTYNFESRTLLPTDALHQNDSTIKTVTAIPAIATFPYTEGFENGNGGWLANGANSSWAWGTPAKTTISSAATGTKAWATSLTGTYNSSEDSHLESPCFNLSSLAAPVIEMKIWWDTEFNYDGAVLQYTLDAGTTWHTIGNFGDPNNWYNSDQINTMPGGQTLSGLGWSGNFTNSSNGWVTAKHRVPALAWQSSVKFRIAFASDPSSQFEGFAVDDVKIYDSPAKDTGISAIISPNSNCSLTNQETVTVQVTNFGIAAQSNIPVSYKIGTNAWVNETIPGPLAPDSTVTFSFATKADLSTVGTYSFETKTNLLNDATPTNDGLTKTVVNVPTISSFPYSQNFDNGANGWRPAGNNCSWALGTPAKLTINSAASGTNSWVTNLTSDYNSNENSAVLSPCFNFSTLVNPMISMKIWWNSEAHWDGAALQSSIDGGQTWQNVGAFGNGKNWYNDNGISSAPGNQIGSADGWSGSVSSMPASGGGGWVIARNYLLGLAGQSSVRFRIAFASDAAVNDEGFAFDDVKIFEAPANDVGILAIKSPVSSTCGGGTQENVTVAIKNFGSATQTSVPVSYSFSGAGTGNGTGTYTGSLAPGDTALFTFPTKANISTVGTYAFSATTSLTGDTTLSNNTKLDTVTIFNPIATFPYIQNFETGIVGAPGKLPNGWTSNTIPSQWPTYRWEVNAGPTFNPNTGPLVDHTLGTAAGQYVFANSNIGMWGDTTELYTPCINLSSLTNAGVDFWYHMAGGAVASLKIDISTNNGLTWDTLTSINGPQQFNKVDPWIKKTISLSGYTGTVKLRFKAYNGGMSMSGGGDIAIDDVRFFNLPTHDLELYTLTLPASNCGLTATETICINIKNSGFTTETNFPVSYTINGGTAVTENCTTSIAPGAIGTYCFLTKANLATAGTFNFSAATGLVTDGDPLNNTKTGDVTSIPTIATLPYVQGFENGDGGWQASGTNSSWALGTPAKTYINAAAAGTKAWVTSLTGSSNSSEHSQVLSPCFNFSGMSDPDFEMKAYWQCKFGNEGAVLQSSIDGGLTWQNVGAFGDTSNWYTTDFIGSHPGGQTASISEGWSGNHVVNGSNGWVTVKHKLVGLGGQSSVKLRIAFATLSFSSNEGFAFDDVKIVNNTNNLAVNSFVPLNQVCAYNSNEPVSVVLQNLGSTPVSGFSLSYTVDGGTAVTQPYPGTLAAGAHTTFTFSTGADLSAAGAHTIVVNANHAPDPVQSNNSISYSVTNALLTNSLPVGVDFETPATDISNMHTVTKTYSAVAEIAAGSYGTSSTKGLVMDGITNADWASPVGITDTWTSNPKNFAGAYICFSPNAAAYDSLLLSFDLKQLFKTANSNTNLRVTVNGTQVGPTYRPPFTGTPIAWQKIKVNLTPYKNLANIQIGLESSVMEEYSNGTGTANLIDNIMIERKLISISGTKNEILESRIQVYPNPSAGIFNISLPASTRTTTLEVTDLTGKVLLKQTASGGTTQVDLTGKAKGIYLLKIMTADGTLIRKLIHE